MNHESRECVIYCRVSTHGQAAGSGLARQLDTCLQYAKERGLFVEAVFSELGSASGGPLPARKQAEAMARLRRCWILVESTCRWTRCMEKYPPGLTVCSQAEVDSMHELADMIGAFAFARVGGSP